MNEEDKKYIGQESGNDGISLSKNYYKQHLQTLDEYLQNKVDYEIYEYLTVYKADLFGSSQKALLNFFQMFYQKVYFIETNKNKPLLVAENLNPLSLTSEQSDFLYIKILNHFQIEKKTDEKLDICCREIIKLQQNLDFTNKNIIHGNTPDPPPAFSPTELSIESLNIMKVSFKDKSLDDFLVSKFNLRIYQDLTDGDEKDLFKDPLDFFQLFYGQLEFIEKNPTKSVTFKNNLNQLPINEHQRRFLFYYVNEMLSKVFNEYSNEQIKVCQTLIEKELNKLDEKLFPEKAVETKIIKTVENFFHFDFDLVKRHLKTLPGNKTQIIYLIEAKADYEQRKNEVNFESVNFVEKCNLEIEKFKQLIQLEAKSEQKEIVAEDGTQINEKIGEREARQKSLGLTQDRAVWAMSYLFESAETKCHNTEKAKFISFLTGFSETKIAQSFSRIEKIKLEMEDKTETSKKNIDDYKIVRKLFETLNLTEIQKQIDGDFGI